MSYYKPIPHEDYEPLHNCGDEAIKSCSDVYDVNSGQAMAAWNRRAQDKTEGVIASSSATCSARWKSKATWPDGETTTDEHDTEAQASAVCKMLRRDGMGGLQEVFPTKTWVVAPNAGTEARRKGDE